MMLKSTSGILRWRQPTADTSRVIFRPAAGAAGSKLPRIRSPVRLPGSTEQIDNHDERRYTPSPAAIARFSRLAARYRAPQLAAGNIGATTSRGPRIARHDDFS